MTREAVPVLRTPHRTIATVSIVLGTFTSVLSSTILNVPLHDIARDLRIPVSQATLLVTAALIAFATLLPLGGWAANRFGRRNVYCIAIAGIAAAGFVAAAARDFPTLVVMRVVQGAGAAMIVPSVMSMLSDLYEPERRALALSAWAMANGLGQALGPPLGGVLASAFSWHAAFIPSPAIATVTLGAALAFVPRDRPAGASLEWRGALAVTFGALALQTAFTLVPQLGAASPVVLASGCAGVVLIALFVRAARTMPVPFVSPRIFSETSYAGACIAVFAITVAFGAELLAVPLELIRVRGLSTDVAGFISFALPLAMAACAPITSIVVRRAGARTATSLALAGMTAGSAALAADVATHGSLVVLCACLLVAGASVALAFTSTAVGATATEAGRYGAGIGVYNVLRIAGTAVGADVVALLLRTDDRAFAAIFAVVALGAAAGLVAVRINEETAKRMRRGLEVSGAEP